MHAVIWKNLLYFNNQTRTESRKELNTHTRHFKTTTICFNWKEAIWSLTKKKEDKKTTKKKLPESLHLTVEMTGSSNYKSHENQSLMLPRRS